MSALRPRGRAAICGGISKYNDGQREPEKFFPTDMIYSFQVRISWADDRKMPRLSLSLSLSVSDIHRFPLSRLFPARGGFHVHAVAQRGGG